MPGRRARSRRPPGPDGRVLRGQGPFRDGVRSAGRGVSARPSRPGFAGWPPGGWASTGDRLADPAGGDPLRRGRPPRGPTWRSWRRPSEPSTWTSGLAPVQRRRSPGPAPEARRAARSTRPWCSARPSIRAARSPTAGTVTRPGRPWRSVLGGLEGWIGPGVRFGDGRHRGRHGAPAGTRAGWWSAATPTTGPGASSPTSPAGAACASGPSTSPTRRPPWRPAPRWSRHPAGRRATPQQFGGGGLLWLESPTNPLLAVADLQALIAGAHQLGMDVAVDNTFATPLLQRPLDLGRRRGRAQRHQAAGRPLGRGARGGRGAAARRGRGLGAPALAARSHRRALGGLAGACGVSGPWRCAWTGPRPAPASWPGAWSPTRSVKMVRYPGLPDHPGHELAARQMRGFGTMVAFEVAGGAAAAEAVVAAVRLATAGHQPGRCRDPHRAAGSLGGRSGPPARTAAHVGRHRGRRGPVARPRLRPPGIFGLDGLPGRSPAVARRPVAGVHGPTSRIGRSEAPAG